jgi:DNA end-binding protein Ku
MRSILNTEIAFGMVRVAVKVYAATSKHDLDLHQYHATDAGRVRNQRVCELEDEPVPAEEIVKGVETDDGELVFLNEDDLKALPVASSKRIEVIGFVPEDQIDPIFFERSYYLGPGSGAAESYVVMRDALREKGKIGIVRITMRQRTSLAALRPREDVLVLETMLWPDEIRLPHISGLDSAVRQQELELADTLINAMAGDFHPEEYTDAYQEALRGAIEAKAHGQPVPKAKAEPRATTVDMMDALTRSVEHLQSPPTRSVKKTAKKATTRKKASAKNAATRQTTARKLPGQSWSVRPLTATGAMYSGSRSPSVWCSNRLQPNASQNPTDSRTLTATSRTPVCRVRSTSTTARPIPRPRRSSATSIN